MKRILLALAFLFGAVTASSAACVSPAVMKDNASSTFNMSLSTNAGDGNCASNVTIVGTVPTTPVTGTFWQTTQPVSGTFWQATQPVSQATSSNLKAQVDPLTLASWGLVGIAPGTAPTNALVGGLICNNGTLSPTAGQSAALQGDVNCNLKVVGVGVADGSTSSGQTTSKISANVTTSPPTYTNAQTDPLTMTTGGGLRTDLSSVAGSAISAGVPTINGGSKYETIAASQTSQVMGATGAAGDYLSHCVLYPTSTSPGVLTVFDGTSTTTNNVITFPGGATSLSNLAPISFPVGAISINSGGWKVTTGANLLAVCYGKFT